VEFGAFTVTHFVIPAVMSYIEKQEEHHARQTFQEEFRWMLSRHGVAPDEEHMWD
jgi:hypothetical protein